MKVLFFFVPEVQEMEENLPRTCKVNFDDHNKLHLFSLIVYPDEGFWSGGKFKFCVDVPEEYNIVVSLYCIIFDRMKHCIIYFIN